MSGTFELRMSETFSLNVRPRTPTLGALHGDACVDEQLHQALGDVRPHAVVDAATCENDLGLVAELLCLHRQVVGIDADAVTADEARRELEEVPLRCSSGQHVTRADAHAIEDQRELVHQSDVEIALRVLDDLCCLSDLDRCGLEHTCLDDRTVGRGYTVERLAVYPSPETTLVMRSNVCCLSPGLMRSGL